MDGLGLGLLFFAFFILIGFIFKVSGITAAIIALLHGKSFMKTLRQFRYECKRNESVNNLLKKIYGLGNINVESPLKISDTVWIVNIKEVIICVRKEGWKKYIGLSVNDCMDVMCYNKFVLGDDFKKVSNPPKIPDDMIEETYDEIYKCINEITKRLNEKYNEDYYLVKN